jgi:tetratricopeptide (TPR) repeat protein/tRNA A-37 threonylcarbamoyl transferase component Bud32
VSEADARTGTWRRAGGRVPDLPRALVDAAVEAYRQLARSEPGFAPHATDAFEELETIGQGGMGVVLRMRDVRLGRQVAIKLIRKPLTPSRVWRFRREAELTASLTHPAIPPVYEAGVTPEGTPYMVMRLIEGQTLAELIRVQHREGAPRDQSWRRGLHRLLEVLIKASEGVAYAHGQGVIHRDLKPENLIVGRYGDVMVMDWGLAKRLDEEQADPGRALESTQEGAFVGTAGFASPEQVRGHADERADVFALGAILTEVLSGQPAIPGEDTVRVLGAMAAGDVRTPRDLDRTVPRDLNAIAAGALARDPDQRTATAEAIAEDLRAYLAGEEVSAHRYSLAERLQRAVRRRPATMVALLGVVLLLGVAGVLGAMVADARRREHVADASRRAAQQAEQLAAAQKREAEARSREAKQAEELAAAQQHEAEATLLQIEGAMALLADASDAFARAQHEDGESMVLQAVEQVPARFVYAQAAQVSKAAKRWQLAVDLLREAVDRFPPAYRELFSLHRIERAANVGDPLGMTPALERLHQVARERGDQNELTLYVEALLALREQEGRRALRLLSQALEHNPAFAPALVSRGALRVAGRELPGAREDFERATQVDPDNPAAWSNLGWTLALMGQPAEGLPALERAVALKPDAESALLNRANVYQELGRLQEAALDYTQILRKRPNAKAFTNRGNTHAKLGNMQQAMSDYQRALSLQPGYVAAILGAANVQQLTGNHAQAVQTYDLILRERPNNLNAALGQASSLIELGRFDEARAVIAHVLGNRPDNEKARQLRRLLDERAGR